MRSALVIAAALLLVGCTPATPEAPPNEEACADFAAATLKVAQSVVNEDDIDIAAAYDQIALAASGDVKDRILKVINNLPEPGHMIAWMNNRDHYSDTLMDVKRACDADGHNIEVALLVAG